MFDLFKIKVWESMTAMKCIQLMLKMPTRPNTEHIFF